MARKGSKPAKNVASLLLILGVFSLFTIPRFVEENPLALYYLALSSYGVILGLVLLLSRDVNYYISIQYEKLPKTLNDNWGNA